jgi:hypothetical protein
MSATFDGPLLESLRDTGTVRIETRRAHDGPVRMTPIWVVVDDSDRVLVRSVRGGRGRWYQDLLANPIGALVVGAARIGVRADLARDPERVEACTRALRAKYAGAGASLASMVMPDVLDCTLELLPD